MNVLKRLVSPIRVLLLRWPMEWLGVLLMVMGLWVVFYDGAAREW